MPTRKERIRAMADPIYALYVGLDLEEAVKLRQGLYALEKEGKVYQDDDGRWYPMQCQRRGA